jgi:hypothetical protein
MLHRWWKPIIALSAFAGLVSLMVARVWTQGTSQSSTQTTANNYKAPRTADGKPDLQGVWSFASPIPLQKPDPNNPRPAGQNEDAAEFDNVVGNYQEFWYEPGGVKDDKRASLIVDPPNGRMPPLTPQAEKRLNAIADARRGLAREEPTPGGWLEDLGTTNLKVRCLVGFNSGPPLNPGGYNQHLQIFQTSGYVALFTEIIHNARIVPTDGRPHISARLWSGDPRGRWEGDTFVVDSQNFRGGLITQYQLSQKSHLIEKFTRVADNRLVYEYTLDDSDIWTKPWTARIYLGKTDERIYEYACHEGNYALPNILAGARMKERSNTQGKTSARK